MRRQIDRSVLEMAFMGYEAERQKIEAAMVAIRKQLGVRGKSAAGPINTAGATPRRKRQLSAAALRRISAAQKKRWAAFHKSKAEKSAPKKAAVKRKLSPERKAALVANLAKASTTGS